MVGARAVAADAFTTDNALTAGPTTCRDGDPSTFSWPGSGHGGPRSPVVRAACGTPISPGGALGGTWLTRRIGPPPPREPKALAYLVLVIT
ncbi:hypothetical protein [Alloactinosynnema sp. L-07]|nr:hypothetical protein [Alloactinosynnema sp. L-07]